ncbi:MAG TPA: alpha/beta fold hydrolase, partial [bacterium]|nr:alpha/beta fold hydrolase [bacterium]
MDQQHPKYNEDFLKVRVNPRAGDGKWEYFTTKSGLRLFVQSWHPEGVVPERVLITLHGMSAHGWYYSLLADELVPYGTSVYSPDYRAHGLSDGFKGDVPDVWELLEDVKEFVAHIKERHPKAKLYVLGESMGGIVNVNLQIDPPVKIDGMLLLAPAIKTTFKFPLREFLMAPLYLLTMIFYPRARVIKVTGNERLGMVNENNIKYDQDDPLHLKYVTTRYMLGVKKLMDRGQKLGAESIKVPALIIQGGKDIGV